jgi:hypothetical protein
MERPARRDQGRSSGPKSTAGPGRWQMLLQQCRNPQGNVQCGCPLPPALEPATVSGLRRPLSVGLVVIT